MLFVGVGAGVSVDGRKKLNELSVAVSFASLHNSILQTIIAVKLVFEPLVRSICWGWILFLRCDVA